MERINSGKGGDIHTTGNVANYKSLGGDVIGVLFLFTGLKVYVDGVTVCLFF